MIARFRYFSGQALNSLRESPALSLLTTATIGIALLVLGIYVMALQNLEELALIWGRTATISVYIDDDYPQQDWTTLRDQLDALPSVKEAALITPEASLERFRSRGPNAAALVADVDPEVLPASIELSLNSAFSALGAVEQVVGKVEGLPGVLDVDYGREEFDRLQALVQMLRYGGVIGGILLAIATAFIVSNTIRLNVYARRDEIAILRLVGATRWFIRTPFLMEGACWGLLGGLMAVGLLWGSETIFAEQLSLILSDVLGGIRVHIFSQYVACGMVISGLVLGVAGSAVAVRRFLGVEPS